MEAQPFTSVWPWKRIVGSCWLKGEHLVKNDVFFLTLQTNTWPAYISQHSTHISQSWVTSRPSTWAWTRTAPLSQTIIGKPTSSLLVLSPFWIYFVETFLSSFFQVLKQLFWGGRGYLLILHESQRKRRTHRKVNTSAFPSAGFGHQFPHIAAVLFIHAATLVLIETNLASIRR